MFPWSELTARQRERNVLPTFRNLRTQALCAEIETNRPRCTLKSRRTERAAHRNHDESHYPPPPQKEARGTKKRYLSKLSSLHLQPACPTSWWEKPAHATRKNQNQNRPLRTYRTYQPDAKLERGWAGGKSSQSQNAELSMQVREPRMDDNRASAADNLRKISPSCVESEKFFSTVVSYEKFNFRLFHCVQPTKIITLCRFTWNMTNSAACTRYPVRTKFCSWNSDDRHKKSLSQAPDGTGKKKRKGRKDQKRMISMRSKSGQPSPQCQMGR